MSVILREEWHYLIRRRRIAVLIVSTMLAMIAATQLIAQQSGFTNIIVATPQAIPLPHAQIGRLFATSLCLALQGWVIVTTPLVAASTSPPTGLQPALPPARLFARLLAVWGGMLLVVLITLPFFSILPLFGSLSWPEIGWAFAVILTSGLLSGAYSLGWIALVQQTPPALVAIYSSLLVWVGAATLIITNNPVPNPTLISLVAFNPFAMIIAPLAPAFPPDGPIAADLQNVLRLTHGPVDPSIPLYRLYLAGSGMLVFIVVAGASWLARPRPRRWQRFDTVLSVMLILYVMVLVGWRDWWWIIGQ
ncbi:MAG: hypothetical protein C0184_08900 [Chloroflexus aggregans]|uniref:Uncharacterized protein n=1 Tax=Chloroflexus aggregans TaxID=152260 RepID=A0A2J6X3Z7_9CHLR|nr:MAG: hypothetical protein C0184_08900 [Chloroflexus aggregans]